jgi:hypothetical protein
VNGADRFMFWGVVVLVVGLVIGFAVAVWL